jgi:hypothetical protein
VLNTINPGNIKKRFFLLTSMLMMLGCISSSYASPVVFAADHSYTILENTNLILDAANGLLVNSVNTSGSPITNVSILSSSNPGLVSASLTDLSSGAVEFFTTFGELGTDVVTYDFTLASGGTSNIGTVDIAVTTTPLPAALPLFAGGLGALGLFGWRRKRKAAAIAA